MDQIVVAVAQLGLYAVGLGALAAWVTTPRRDRAAFALAAVLAVVAVLVCVKAAGAAWTDPRPFVVDGRAPLFSHVSDNGFPSDHTMLAMAVAAVVAWWRRKVGAGLMALSVVVGAARVGAHVHHVPDVVGALLIGTACAAAAVMVASRVGHGSRAVPLPAHPGPAAARTGSRDRARAAGDSDDRHGS